MITLNPIPTLSSLDPNNGTAGSGGFTLTVNGTNFVNGAVVNWNGAARTTAFINDTRLTATIPATDLATLGTASVTIVNPEPGGGASNALPFAINAPASLQFSTATYSVNENGGTATITVTRSGNTGNAVMVNYTTANGTATAGNDYTAASGTLSFAADAISQTFTIAITDDNIFEGNESVNLNLSSPSAGAILGTPATAVLTIVDNETQPTLSINDVAVTEGNSGTTPANFTVSLSGPSSQNVTVQYATANGTATAGADYQAIATPQTLTIPAGQTSVTAPVNVIGDTLDEPDETFFVNLTNPTGATLADNQGQGTITDDDPPPALSINDVAVTEGNTGTVNALFTVSLSAASGQTVTVQYQTANGTATAPADYTALPLTTLTFAPGETAQQLTVPVFGDTLDEDNETFFVNLSGAVNATLGDNQGQGTITDDDPPPALSINDISVVEGNSGTTNAVFTVMLTPASGRTVTVNYATADGTAAAGSDYQATNGTLTFNASQTTQTITVLVNGDTLNEANETFFVNLTAPANATLGDSQGQGTITNDDSGLPLVNINNASVTEGNSGTVAANFTVSLSTASGQTVTVNYATANGTATAGADYQAVTPPQTVTFAAGETSKTVGVTVLGDTLDEDDETFSVILSNPANAQIGAGTGTGTILDDDPAPTLSLNNTAVTEGNSGTVTATLTVTLSAVSGRDVTVDYATADGTATAPADYQPAAGRLTFTPGQTTRAIPLTVNGDTMVEGDETFRVNLTNPAGATLAAASGQVTITDDDTGVEFSAAGYTVSESGGAATINVRRTGLATAPFTVNYATADGTALQRTDYTVASGTLSFAAGETLQSFPVLVTDDTLVEPGEQLTLALSNPTGGATLGVQQSAVLTITDDDTQTQTARMSLARLGGAQEVPATNSAATGSGTFVLSADETSAQVALSFAGLSSGQTAAHIHGPAPVGANAPVLFTLPNGTVTNFTLTNLTPTQVQQLKAGLWYFNVHTGNFPNGEVRGQILAHPLESAPYFVRQQYADFLSRVPDQAGLDYWAGQLTNCGADLNCLSVRRREVSNAFFFELEYQQTGAYVYRLYRAAFGNSQPFPNTMGDMDSNPYCTANPANCQLIRAAHLPAYANFAADRAQVVGGTQLAATQLALATVFAGRAEFVGRYPLSQSADQYVDALLATIQAASGANLSGQRSALIALYNGAGNQPAGRGAVLFRLAQDDAAGNPVNNRAFIDAEYNRAFVTTQYFGYLRRDGDLPGLNFWLSVLNQSPPRDVGRQLGMVCAFITSAEYQERFGAVTARGNGECP